MLRRSITRPALVALLLAAATPGAEAMPVAPEAPGSATVQPVQYGPGHNRTVQYRRALRRYRGNPGAQHELRQNRRIYCRNTPERC